MIKVLQENRQVDMVCGNCFHDESNFKPLSGSVFSFGNCFHDANKFSLSNNGFSFGKKLIAFSHNNFSVKLEDPLKVCSILGEIFSGIGWYNLRAATSEFN